jgi:hypothetical protein
MEVEMTLINIEKLEVRSKEFALVIDKGVTSHIESIGKQLKNYIVYLKRSKQGKRNFQRGILFEKNLCLTF